jgi:Mg2+ and Co2+ transporter CorA
VPYDYGLLNAGIAGLARKVADAELSASTLREFAERLFRLVEFCENYQSQTSTAKTSSPIISEQREGVQATISRADLYLKHMKMTQDVVQSLTAVLYNRINEHDSQSMKTIAVVTLFFLSATFVSSIFSTVIFNFHASEGNNPQTISKYGWVYLLIYMLLTALSLIIWACWYRWGSL